MPVSFTNYSRPRCSLNLFIFFLFLNSSDKLKRESPPCSPQISIWPGLKGTGARSQKPNPGLLQGRQEHSHLTITMVSQDAISTKMEPAPRAGTPVRDAGVGSPHQMPTPLVFKNKFIKPTIFSDQV